MTNDPMVINDVVELIQFTGLLIGGGAVGIAAAILGCMWWFGR